jgi:hypothetical protein
MTPSPTSIHRELPASAPDIAAFEPVKDAEAALAAVNALQLVDMLELDDCCYGRYIELVLRMMMRIGRDGDAEDLVLEDLNPCCFNILGSLLPGARTRTVTRTAAGPSAAKP